MARVDFGALGQVDFPEEWSEDQLRDHIAQNGQSIRTSLIEANQRQNAADTQAELDAEIDAGPDELGVGQEIRGAGRAAVRGVLRAGQSFEALASDMMVTGLEAGQRRLEDAKASGNQEEVARLQEFLAVQPDILSRKLSGIATAEREIATLPESPDIRNIQENFWSKLAQNPVETIATVSLESLPQAVPGMVAGGALGGPGGMAAGVGMGSLATEYASSLLDSARLAGFDLTNPEQATAFFADPQNLAEARSKALKRGAPVAAFDALSGGLAGRFLKPALGTGIKPVAKATAKELALQSGTGMTGEAAGQLASEGKVTSIPDIVLEGIAELGTAPGEIVGNIRGEMQKATTVKVAVDAEESGLSQTADLLKDMQRSADVLTPALTAEDVQDVILPTEPIATEGMAPEPNPAPSDTTEGGGVVAPPPVSEPTAEESSVVEAPTPYAKEEAQVAPEPGMGDGDARTGSGTPVPDSQTEPGGDRGGEVAPAAEPGLSTGGPVETDRGGNVPDARGQAEASGEVVPVPETAQEPEAEIQSEIDRQTREDQAALDDQGQLTTQQLVDLNELSITQNQRGRLGALNSARVTWLRSKATPDQLATIDAAVAVKPPAPANQSTNPFDTSTTSKTLTDVQTRKPRPLKKLFGKTPTPEQEQLHASAMRDWNREHRAAQKAHKDQVKKSNEWLAENAPKDRILAALDTAIEATSTTGKVFDAVAGVSMAVANTLLKTVRAAYLGGKALTAAIREAIAEHRKAAPEATFNDEELSDWLASEAVKPSEDQNLGIKTGTAEKPLTTKRGTVKDTVPSRPGLTQETNDDARLTSEAAFREAGLQFERAPGEELYRPTAEFEQEIEGRKLVAIARRVIQDATTQGRPERVANLVNSLRQHFAESPAFSTGLAAELGIIGQSKASELGRGLGALALNARELGGIARNIQAALTRERYSVFSGETIERLMSRIVERFKNLFTDEEIDGLSTTDPRLEAVVKKLSVVSLRDDGGRVYRAVQNRLKPKTQVTQNEKEKRAREEEAIAQIIENAKKLGIDEPPSKNKPLTPDERLGLMTRPSTQAKIQEATEQAVRDAEFNAGWKVMEAEAAIDGDQAVIDRYAEAKAVGETPTPEAIEKGLELPEYAHWKTIRDGFLAYSPTTMSLVQDVIRGRFKGVSFGEKKAPPASSLKVDVNKLAVEPDAEVDRVVSGQLAAIDGIMDLNGATQDTKARVRTMIVRNVASQVQAARQRVIDGFLNPKDRPTPKTASERLRGLVNAGIAKDGRYRSQPVRDLLKRVASAYIKAQDFTSVAVKPRSEKLAFLESLFDTIVSKEGIADEWMRGAVWTHFTERLMEAETAVASRMAGAKEATFEPAAQKTDAERETARQKAIDKLTGGIRAGLIDQRLVEDVALKPVFQRLTPKMSDLVRQVLDTPVSGQAGLAKAFANSIGRQLRIDPALADKAGAVLASAFKAKFEGARKKALDKAVKDLTPVERDKVGPGTTVWKKIEALVNAGGMETSAVLQKLAADAGWKPPSESEVVRFKELAAEEQDLRTLTAEEKAKGITQEEKDASTIGKRAVLIREMRTRWARMVSPIRGNRFNRAQAINEFVSANLLARPSFGTKQIIDVATQMFYYTPTRAVSEAVERFKSDKGAGRETRLWKDVQNSIADAYGQRRKSLDMALSQAKEAAKGKTEKEIVAGIQTEIRGMDRLVMKADELAKDGDHAKAFILRVVALTRLAFRFASALDHFQGSQAEQQEMLAQVETELRERGVEPDDARRQAKDIMGDHLSEFALAQSIVAQLPDLSEADRKAAVWNVVRARQYQRMESAGLPADAFQELNDKLRNTIGWNEREAGGFGGVLGTFVSGMSDQSARMGLPLPLARFGNAIAIGTNRALTFAGGGFFPSAFGDSPWYKTQKDRTQRKIEAATGLSIGGVFVALAMAGALRVYTDWPDDKEERELWERDGHRPNTVELDIGNGRFIRVSLSVGPLSITRPFLYALGKVQTALGRKRRQNERAAKAAGKKGSTLEPVELNAIDILSIAAYAGWGAVFQGRTTGGLLGSTQYQGQFDVKRLASSAVAPVIPFQPLLRESATLAGKEVDPKRAPFIDVLLPTPWSEGKKNFLGDPVGTPRDADRILSILTGGTTLSGGDETEKAYYLIKESGWTPPSINPNQYFQFGSMMRQMTPDELRTFETVRAEELKRGLNKVDSRRSVEPQMKAALEAATSKARKAIGAR